MTILENLKTLTEKSEQNLKTGTEQIRYELARKGLTKTPSGAEQYLEQSVKLLTNEVLDILAEVRSFISKPKEWELIRSSMNGFIDTQYDAFYDFLVNNWQQPSSQVTSQLLSLKASILRESHSYIDRQKIKLSKGEQLLNDMVKIFYCGLAAGIVGFLIRLLFSR
ncbi:MAG: hypothetical protein GX075_13310 [Firmicutes bacterium]|nr:hypothetical protein [Bacillota bacterium]